jgi:hypothetical protein
VKIKNQIVPITNLFGALIWLSIAGFPVSRSFLEAASSTVGIEGYPLILKHADLLIGKSCSSAQRNFFH